jgi:peptidylprolyl isomerase
MAQAQPGDTVRIHYTGTLGDGEVFDTSEGREPLAFTLGEGEVIAGFDAAVAGMAPGEKKTVTIPADEAYGQHRDEMVLQVGRDQLPPGLDPEEGDALTMSMGDGMELPVLVREVTDDHIVLDANHPLAGEDLTFEIELVGIDARPGGLIIPGK